MPENWWLVVLICGGISVGLLWGGWQEWGVKTFLVNVLKFSLLMLTTAVLLTMCGDFSIRGR